MPHPTPKHHILSVLVENKAGVLARVASLFARRGYNIYSLAVAPTDDERFSRITIVVDVESAPLEQIVKQLNKLINVIKISELDPRDSVERELHARHRAGHGRARAARSSSWCDIFGGRSSTSATTSSPSPSTSSPSRLDDLEELLRPFGIIDLQRTGRVALPRLERTSRARPPFRRLTVPGPAGGLSRPGRPAGPAGGSAPGPPLPG